MELNKELIQKAKEAKSPEELMSLAKDNGVEMTGESATAYFEQLNRSAGELSDEELDNVAGGGCQDVNRRLDVTVKPKYDDPCGKKDNEL